MKLSENTSEQAKGERVNKRTGCRARPPEPGALTPSAQSPLGYRPPSRPRALFISGTHRGLSSHDRRDRLRRRFGRFRGLRKEIRSPMMAPSPTWTKSSEESSFSYPRVSPSPSPSLTSSGAAVFAHARSETSEVPWRLAMSRCASGWELRSLRQTIPTSHHSCR